MTFDGFNTTNSIIGFLPQPDQSWLLANTLSVVFNSNVACVSTQILSNQSWYPYLAKAVLGDLLLVQSAKRQPWGFPCTVGRRQFSVPRYLVCLKRGALTVAGL